jgi:hypothetical protein
MKKIWGYIVGAFALVFGMFFYERTKRKSAEALNDANNARKEVDKKQAEILKNNALLGIEEIDRNKQKELLDKKINEKLTDSDLNDFFKRRQ